MGKKESSKSSAKKKAGQTPVKITDTTFRDAHQSSLATRMRMEDMPVSYTHLRAHET